MPDDSSHLLPPMTASWVNVGQSTNLADTHHSDHTERREEASDLSYAYRPVPIDVDPQEQTHLGVSLPSNNTSSSVSNRNTDTQQGLASIKEDKMPREPSGKFILNPEAPVFKPSQEGQIGQLVQEEEGMLPLSQRPGWGRI